MIQGGIEVTFNGIKITEYLDVTQEFSPFKGVDYVPATRERSGDTSGEDFLYLKHGAKTIPMPYISRNNRWLNYDRLEEALNVSEPKELIFSHTPDRKYYAVPTGDMDTSETWDQTSGTITWFIPEGIAYSTTVKTFAATVTNSVLKVQVNNEGTGDATLSYDIHNNEENGYIAGVSYLGAWQVGNPLELDNATAIKSVWKYNLGGYSKLITGTVNTGYVPIIDSQHSKTGSWSKHTNQGVDTLQPSTGSGNQYHGPTMMYTFDATKNWEVQFRLWMALSKVEGGGIMGLVMSTDDGSYRTGVALHKDQRYDARFVWKAYDGIPTGKGASSTRKTSSTRNIFQETKNKLSSWKKGTYRMVKKGSIVTIYFPDGGSYVISDSKSDVEYTKLTIFSMSHGTSSPVTRMNWISVKLRIDDVVYETSKDVVNSYPAGSDMYIEGSTSKVYLENAPIASSPGSTFFKVPPGETEIEFYYSDFVSRSPDVVVTLQEVFN